MAAYLRPTAAIAADVLLPADPGLAMELAQRLMVKPSMANHHHGLWGYSGVTPDGRALTVQAGGIGAPSTVAVVAELVRHGARRVIRIGRCAAIDPGLEPAETLIVEAAVGADGTSAALAVADATPDPELAQRLRACAPHATRLASVVSFDLGAAAQPPLRRRWSGQGIAAVDLETAALLSLGARLGLAVACGLVVTELAEGDEADEPSAQAALIALGECASSALAPRSSEATLP